MSSDPANKPIAELGSGLLSDLEFDLVALRNKYREERDKRIRVDGENQFIHTTGEYSGFKDVDPYADPLVRNTISVETEVLVMGGGFAGLSAAGRLIEAGFEDLRLIDNASDFGGTWYWNRYPGAQCDIDSYCYLPLLEETGYIPIEKYSFAPEIYEHAQRIAKRYGLYDKAIFQTAITALNWDEENLVWNISTNRGDDIKARFVVCGSGPGTTPRLPGIPGIDEFQGHSFHTSRWDFDYTGGNNKGNLSKLADKRIAVIGTGASSIQVVPHLGEHAEHLYVFQRTPSALNPRGNIPTDPEWVKTLKPGWQSSRQANFNDVVEGHSFEEDLVNDGWTDMFRNLQNSLLSGNVDTAGISPDQIALLAEIVDARKQNGVRDRVDVPEKAYIDALLGVYELNRTELLADVFVWAYERSCARYSAVRQSLGEPDPFRIRYREHIAKLVTTIVSDCMDKRTAVSAIKHYALERILKQDQERFVEMIETELMSLHEGNIARYRVRPSQFEKWRSNW